MSKVRKRQRAKYGLLESSANETAMRLASSLNTNGYKLMDGSNSEFSFLILTKFSDCELLRINIELLNLTYSTKYRQIHVLTDIDSRWEDFRKSLKDVPNLSFSSEQEYDSQLQPFWFEINKYREVRQKWIKQQILKTLYVNQSSQAVVILDSDTFLMREFSFVDGEKQLLFAGADFHSAYSKHVAKFLQIVPTALSFVHHCQVQLPRIVKDIYFRHESRTIGNWLSSGEKLGEYSAVSEFQTYGDYTLKTEPKNVSIFFHKHHEISLEKIPLRNLRSYILNHSDLCNCDLLTVLNKEVLENPNA
jgi:hypothetical protein